MGPGFNHEVYASIAVQGQCHRCHGVTAGGHSGSSMQIHWVKTTPS